MVDNYLVNIHNDKKMAKNRINEDLKRFNSLMDYDPSKGGILSEKVQPWRYSINEAEPEEGEGDKEKENPEFDFGDEGNPEDQKGDQGFDFGGEDQGDDAGFDFGSAEGEAEQPEEDEFGTADEFSAADELESGEDVEEIDVTDIVKKSDEATEFAKKALSVGQENGEFLKSLTDKLSNLESQLTKMDSIASKISKLEQDIKTPEEKLELRSLDSYPFNMKLTDYWSEKAAQNKHYDITGGETNVDGKEKEFRITADDVNDYNDADIKRSFVPESVTKKKILKEQQLLNEGLSDIFKRFSNRKQEIKDQLSDELGVEEGDDKETIQQKVKNVLGEDVSESKIKRFAKRVGGSLGRLLINLLTIYTAYKAGVASPLGYEGDIIAFFGYGIASFLLMGLRDDIYDRRKK